MRRLRAPRHYRNHVEVGPSKAYAFQNVQAALDSITDAAAENRYLVSIAPGIYDLTAPIVHDKSFVDLHGAAGAHGTILRRPSTSVATGGTLVIGNAVFTEDVAISDLRVIRNQNGSVPPEGAIYLGSEGLHPLTPTWDKVTIRGCIVEGVHDGVQAFGLDAAHAGDPPVVLVQGNIIRCSHDALTMKGSMRMSSVGNSIDVDSRGRTPYLTDIGEWKATGIHVNVSVGNPGPSATSWLVSSGDVIHVRDGSNVDLASPPAGAFQRRMAGVLIYVSATPGSLVTVCPIRIINPSILVEWNIDGSPGGGAVSGIGTYTQTNCVHPLGAVEIVGGSIRVHQKNAGSSAPASVWGVHHHAETATSYLQVAGTYIAVRNDKAGGNAYSLRADHVNSTIYSRAYSHNAIDAGGAGTIAALPIV